MKFANRQQMCKIVKRRVAQQFRENDVPLRLTPEAELLCEIICQAWEDCHYVWFFDANSFFFEICELLGLNAKEIQELAIRGSKKMYHKHHGIAVMM